MPSAPPRLTINRTFWAGLAYFALVFGAGFVLGSIRIFLILPRVGERVAELLEASVMLVVIVVVVRWVADFISLV